MKLDKVLVAFILSMVVGGAYYAWITQRLYMVAGMNLGILTGAMIMELVHSLRDQKRQEDRLQRRTDQRMERLQCEREGTEPAHVCKSDRAEGFFEVVGGINPYGKPYNVFYTPDASKAERIADMRNKGHGNDV